MDGKIVVAGGTGFLGRNLCNRLDKGSIGYRTFSRSTGVDIYDYSTLVRTIEGADIVINCAALSGGYLYNKTDQVGIFRGNLMIGLNLLMASHEAGIKKLVNIIPNCVYPGNISIYKEEKWLAGDVHDSVRAIASPRRAIWHLAYEYKEQYGLNSIHLVLPNMYGPYDHFDPIRSHAMGALISKIVNAEISGNKAISVWGTGKAVRDWLYVEDAVEGILKAIDLYNDIDILNIGTGNGHSITSIANMIKSSVGWDGEFIYDTTKSDGASSKIMGTEKMKSILNWEPPTPIEVGIDNTVKYYREHVND